LTRCGRVFNGLMRIEVREAIASWVFKKDSESKRGFDPNFLTSSGGNLLLIITKVEDFVVCLMSEFNFF